MRRGLRRSHAALPLQAPEGESRACAPADDDARCRNVLEEELTFVGDDGEVTAPVGTFFLARPGVRLGFHNATGEPVRLLNIHTPAGLDRRFLADR